MTAITSTIEQITRSSSCVVEFNESGMHIFGNEISNYNIIGCPQKCRLQNIALIDTNDENSPIIFDDVVYLPLIFPLKSGSDDLEIVYAITSELEINIRYLSKFSFENLSRHFSLDALPGKKFNLRPMTYEERRIYHSSISDPSPEDALLLERLNHRNCWRISGMIDYCNGIHEYTCITGTICKIWNFATFKLNSEIVGDIWEDLTGSELCFGVCFDCLHIHGYLRRD